jgi:hypothetical protein
VRSETVLENSKENSDEHERRRLRFVRTLRREHFGTMYLARA